MSRPIPTSCVALFVAGTLVCSGDPPASDVSAPDQGPGVAVTASPRLCVFDCGYLRSADPGAFSLTIDEVSTLEMSVPCYLIEHADGRLIWDTGLSDSLAEPAGAASAD